jgi:hypothetical protein
MIDDILFDSNFMTFEVDSVTASTTISGYNYDGENFDFSPNAGEISVVFIG